MELSFDAGTAERFARGVWGLLSFIALIIYLLIYLRWQSDHSSTTQEPVAKLPELVRKRQPGPALMSAFGGKADMSRTSLNVRF